MAVQREEAGKIAFAQGISQGALQKALETAKSLLQLGLSVENIAKATGLSQAEVRELYS